MSAILAFLIFLAILGTWRRGNCTWKSRFWQTEKLFAFYYQLDILINKFIFFFASRGKLCHFPIPLFW